MKKRRKAYLTKRIVERVSRAAFKKAAEETIIVMGYNVEVVNNQVVKKFADGHIEYMGPISSAHTTKVILD